MIYDKKVYSKVSYLNYLLRRIKLAIYKTSACSVRIDEKFLLPYSEANLDVADILKLNESCHVKAFVDFEDSVSIDLSKCDSCGNCVSINDSVYMRDETGLSNQMLLKLNR